MAFLSSGAISERRRWLSHACSNPTAASRSLRPCGNWRRRSRSCRPKCRFSGDNRTRRFAASYCLTCCAIPCHTAPSQSSCHRRRICFRKTLPKCWLKKSWRPAAHEATSRCSRYFEKSSGGHQRSSSSGSTRSTRAVKPPRATRPRTCWPGESCSLRVTRVPCSSNTRA